MPPGWSSTTTTSSGSTRFRASRKSHSHPAGSRSRRYRRPGTTPNPLLRRKALSSREKLQLQANVLIEKLALLEHTSRQASDTLKDVCQRAAASAWAPSAFRRLAREVEPSIRAEGEALTVLSKTPTAMRAEAARMIPTKASTRRQSCSSSP